jgi:hypothetical protein
MTSVIAGALVRRPEIRPIRSCKLADVGDGAEVARLADVFQDVIGDNVSLAFFDEGCTGVVEVRSWGIELRVVDLPSAKCGFVFLSDTPRHSSVCTWSHSFA